MRQHQIEHDQLVIIGLEEAAGFGAVDGGAHRKSGRTQATLEAGAQPLGVFNQ
nr:hypothetical protein [Nitrococcus mobilis]